MIERLENRQYFSAVVDTESHSIKVIGTDAADVITVARRGGKIIVTENGARTSFDATNLSWIDVEGGAGDDRIVALGAFKLRLRAYGQGGNNILIGGRGDDLLYGGEGTDQILGRGGNDQLHSTTGPVINGDAADLLDGGAGNDTLTAGGSKGIVLGGAGNDAITLSKNSTEPLLVDGGAGSDTLASSFFASHNTGGVPTIRRVEGREFYNIENNSANPMIHLYASRTEEGIVTVWVEALHYQGGYKKHFGALAEVAGGYQLQVTGTDLAGPGDGRTQALVPETRPYVLGELAPGPYTFTVLAGAEVRATLQIHVTASGLRNTPTEPGPYSEL